jgi:hypothetical protein
MYRRAATLPREKVFVRFLDVRVTNAQAFFVIAAHELAELEWCQ